MQIPLTGFLLSYQPQPTTEQNPFNSPDRVWLQRHKTWLYSMKQLGFYCIWAQLFICKRENLLITFTKVALQSETVTQAKCLILLGDDAKKRRNYWPESIFLFQKCVGLLMQAICSVFTLYTFIWLLLKVNCSFHPHAHTSGGVFERHSKEFLSIFEKPG